MIAGAERRKGAYVWLVFAGCVAVVSTAGAVWLLTRISGLAWASGIAAGVLATLLLQWRLQRELNRLVNLLRSLPEMKGALPAPSLSEFDSAVRAAEQAGEAIKAQLVTAGESRRELEALLDSMQDPVLAVDATGRVQWTNHRMQLLFPRNGPGGIRLGYALVQTIRDPEVLECIRGALEQGVVTERRSTTLVPGRIFSVSASPTPGGGAVAVLHDRTRVEEVERTQKDFVANVSHELRTPLTSISGYVEILLDHEPGLGAQSREFLETILKNASRMTRLTEDLLVMARVEASSLDLRVSPVRVGLLVEDAIGAVRGLVRESGATVDRTELPDALVLADHDAVMQVLGNLIENAVRYGRNGSPAQITVSVRLLSEPFAAAEFCVADRGPGISSEHLTRIFERFYRVDKARSRESGGTGLGLSIVRHMVQAQGGSIRAESTLGSGSRFLFTLPVVQE